MKHKAMTSGMACTALLLLAGCSTAPDSALPSAQRDTAAGMTCAAVSTLDNTIHNSGISLKLGEIDESQHAAILNAAADGFTALTKLPESDRGLRTEVKTVVDFIESAEPTASGARFDPDAEPFHISMKDLFEACTANGTDVVIWAE